MKDKKRASDTLLDISTKMAENTVQKRIYLLEKQIDEYKEMVHLLKWEVSKKELENESLKGIIANIKKGQIDNSRGAGRKKKFTKAQVEEILKVRESGATIQQIADSYECSTGLIHKIITECTGIGEKRFSKSKKG